MKANVVQVSRQLEANIDAAVAVTTDCWTGRNLRQFMCVTCHFIDRNWSAVQLCLGMEHFPGKLRVFPLYRSTHCRRNLKQTVACTKWSQDIH